jgi:Type II restriction endonuclease, TdeIII
MDESYKQKIANEFRNCVKKTIERITSRNNEIKANINPFQNALLSKEAIFWSRFERSFSTSFGQKVVETISKDVVLATGAENATRQKVVEYYLAEEEIRNISYHIDSLRSNSLGRKPHWDSDLASVQINNPIRTQRVKSRFDLWYQRGGIDHYVSIKTVKPNIDQVAKAKEDFLRIKTAFSNCQTYLGLYYNPYGEERELYNHSPAFKIFDMLTDCVVLIGKDYWDTIGCPGTYKEILLIAEGVSEETSRILEKYVSENSD